MQQDCIKVLIADDNKDFVTMLGACLSLYPDMEIVGIARDGAEVLRQIERLRPDVLLLDIVMPRMNGMEVLAKLSASMQTRPIAIVLSAIGGEQVIRRAIELGAAYYFIKPFNTEVMIEKIRSAIAGPGDSI